MTDRFKLVEQLSKEIIDTYDAAEDYSEDKLHRALDIAAETGVSTQFIAREVFEGAIALVIDELLTTDVGLEILYRINAHRREQDTDKVTDTGQIYFNRTDDAITVISKNFSEPQPSDWQGKVLAHVPYRHPNYTFSKALRRAEDIAEAIARFTIENPPE